MFRDRIHGADSYPLISVLAAIHVFQDPHPLERPGSHHSCSPKTGHAACTRWRLCMYCLGMTGHQVIPTSIPNSNLPDPETHFRYSSNGTGRGVALVSHSTRGVRHSGLALGI